MCLYTTGDDGNLIPRAEARSHWNKASASKRRRVIQKTTSFFTFTHVAASSVLISAHSRRKGCIKPGSIKFLMSASLA